MRKQSVIYALLLVVGYISGATTSPIVHDLGTAQASQQVIEPAPIQETNLVSGLYHPQPYGYVDITFFEQPTWVLTYLVGGTQVWNELGRAQRRPTGDIKARATQGEAIWASYIRLDDGREARDCVATNLPLDAEYTGGSANPTRAEAAGKAGCNFQAPVVQQPATPTTPGYVPPAVPTPAAAQTCTATQHPPFESRVGSVWYPVGKPGWFREVHFWSNWTQEGSVFRQERKLWLEPHHNVGLHGGGTVWSWPPECASAAREAFNKTPRNEVSLSELQTWRLTTSY